MPPSTELEHGPVFSWYRSHGGLVFTSGHAAVDVDDLSRAHVVFEQEVRLTLNNLRRTLEQAGSSMDKVLKITAYLRDMNRYSIFNKIYESYFPGDDPPARTCVQVQGLPFGFQIEIEAVAHV